MISALCHRQSLNPTEPVFGRYKTSYWTWLNSYMGHEIPSYQLCQPEFVNDGPRIRFTPDESGVFAELSPKAWRHWGFAVFQLAHESVHLLDPGRRGTATYLEEGVAVAFSHHVQPLYGTNIVTNRALYRCAHELVKELPSGHLAADRIRQAVGRLRDATADDLRALFPDDLSLEDACALASLFPVH